MKKMNKTDPKCQLLLPMNLVLQLIVVMFAGAKEYTAFVQMHGLHVDSE